MNKKIISVMLAMVLSLAIIGTGCTSEESKTDNDSAKASEQQTDNDGKTDDSTGSDSKWVPEDDITIRVPSAAGGGFDTYVRIFGQGIQESMDATVIVSNLPGANGSIAAGDLMNFDPSPYELMGGNIGMFTTAPLFNPDQSLDLDDFELIGSLASGEFCLYVSPEQSGIESFEDLIEYAKSNEVLIGSQPPGSAVHALVTYLFNETDIEYTTVISNGANKDILSVATGDITISVGYPNVGMQYVQEGSIVPILTFSKDPCTEFDGIEVPTATSKGLDLVFRANNYVMARKGTDPDALAQMYDAFIEWQGTDAFKELASSTKYVPYNQKSEELKQEIERAAELFKVIFDKYYKK